MAEFSQFTPCQNQPGLNFSNYFDTVFYHLRVTSLDKSWKENCSTSAALPLTSLLHANLGSGPAKGGVDDQGQARPLHRDGGGVSFYVGRFKGVQQLSIQHAACHPQWLGRARPALDVFGAQHIQLQLVGPMH
eukprot:g4424.t1